MGLLIDELLSFSRMGRTEMLMQQVDVDKLVRSVIDELKDQVRQRNVEWTIQGLPEVRGDPSMLRLVFMNLLSNAVKYSRGNEHPAVEIGALPPQDGEAGFFVRDNGAGFDMKYVDKLFGVFQRLHRSDEFEGTGIGLATVRRIVSRHGGRTWAESDIGKGATFFFTLSVHPS